MVLYHVDASLITDGHISGAGTYRQGTGLLLRFLLG